MTIERTFTLNLNRTSFQKLESILNASNMNYLNVTFMYTQRVVIAQSIGPCEIANNNFKHEGNEYV